ncbi:MAG: hypothetical protein JWR69_4766 [Pedosphaera sp.]|nr:hypothetical protein [Pedosphaera sp.]
MVGTASRISRTVFIAVSVWLLIALAAGYLRLLEPAPRVAIQGILVALTAGVLLAFWKIRSFHDWLMALSLRALILFHAVRFIGLYFLVLYRRGELPFAFAVPGGYGDIAVAITALLVAGCLLNNPASRRIILTWNLLGLIDILLVVVTAARLGLAKPDSMLALTRLPLSLLPTFIVPLIITSHLIIFYRLRRSPHPA